MISSSLTEVNTPTFVTIQKDQDNADFTSWDGITKFQNAPSKSAHKMVSVLGDHYKYKFTKEELFKLTSKINAVKSASLVKGDSNESALQSHLIIEPSSNNLRFNIDSCTVTINFDQPVLQTGEDEYRVYTGCACCGGYGNPCADCPPVLGNWNFTFSGDQVTDVTEFEYDSIVCPSDNCNIADFHPITPRVCSDTWDAYGTGPFGTNRLYMIALNRASGGFYGLPPTTPCCWILDLYVQGYFEYEFEGFTDICGVAAGGRQIILNETPVGSYPFTLYSDCLPPFMEYPPFPFNFNVVVS